MRLYVHIGHTYIHVADGVTFLGKVKNLLLLNIALLSLNGKFTYWLYALLQAIAEVHIVHK